MEAASNSWFLLQLKKATKLALDVVAQWTACQPTNRKVAGLILGQVTCLGCGQGLQLGVSKGQPVDVSLTHQCFSASLSAPTPLPKNK